MRRYKTGMHGIIVAAKGFTVFRLNERTGRTIIVVTVDFNNKKNSHVFAKGNSKADSTGFYQGVDEL